MALLGILDQRRPSKDIESKRKRNNENRRGDEKNLSRKNSSRHLYPDNEKKYNANHGSDRHFSMRLGSKLN